MSDIRLVKKGEDKLKNITGFGVNRNAVKQMELTAKSSFETLQNYNTKLNNREYLSSDDLKSYKSAMNSYIENNNRLRKLNKIFGQGYTDVQENEWNDAIISLQSGYKEASDYFSQFKDVNEYNDTLAAIKQREKMKTDDLDALKKQLEGMKKEFDYWDKKASSILDDFIPSYEKTTKFLPKNNLKDPLNPYVNPTISQHPLYPEGEMPNNDSPYFSGITLEDAKKQIEEAEAYYKQAKYIQDGIKLTNDALNAEDFEEKSTFISKIKDKQENDWDVDTVSDLILEYINGDKELQATITNKRRGYLAMEANTGNIAGLLTEEWITPTKDEYDWSLDGYDSLNEEERRIATYYYNTDYNKFWEYLKLNEDVWKTRSAIDLAEQIDDNFYLKSSLALANANDRIMQNGISFFNWILGKDMYVEPTRIQLASQYVRKNLDGFEAFAYDAIDTFAYMTPSILMNVAIPGSGFVVTGMTAAGGAYNDGIKMGMSVNQAKIYGTLIGVAEAGLESLFNGVAGIGGKLTGIGIEKMVAGINSGIIKFVATLGVNTVSEGFEEMAQEVLEPLFENVALGYEKNNWDDIDWDEAVYAGLLGAFLGGTSNVVTGAPQLYMQSSYANKVYGFSQGSVDALIKNGLAMPEGSVAYSQAVKAQAKVQNGKKVSGTSLYNLATAIQSEITTKSEVRLAELGVSKGDVKTLAPIVAKAVVGEKLTLEEQSLLNNSEAARQVVKELSADPVNTIWKDAVKGEALQSTANGEGDSVSAVDAFDDGETTGLASGVVQGADGKQYFNDGSGDEYFGDAEGADAPHLTTASGGASPQGEAIDGRAFDLSEPTQKDIARAPTSQEAFDEAITGKQKTNIQRHIVDICKQLDSGITVEFVDGLKTNGKFVRSQNKILIRSDLSAVQMYVEVFKHEFMHRIETKQLYGKFFDYCFKKSTAFEQYVRAELKSAGVDYNVDTATRVGVIEAYTKYKFDQYKNSKVIPQKDRDAFTMENAREEIIADFFAEVLFQGEQYREKIIEALENADADTLLDIGDEISSENALLELQQKEPTLFEQVVEWIRDIINKLRGMPQAKTLESDLEYLEDMLARVYWSKDSKKALQNKAKESDISYCFARCEDSELISQAEKMEKMGEQPIPIYQELGIVRNVYGEWATEIELDGYRFSPYGNWQSYGLVKKHGQIEGRLRDIVIWPKLYEKFPEFEDVKIIIKPSEFEHDTMKFIPDENTGTIFINQKLCDDYIDRTNFDAKVLMVETIQHMIQHKEGNYSEKNYDYWKMLEEKGELPYSKKLGRYLTADDMMKYFADNYDANIAGRRQFMKYIATNLDKKPDSYKNSVLYLPNIDPEEVIVYGKRGKLMSLKEKNTVKKRFNILDKNYNSNTKETESHIFDEKGEATQSLRNLVWQKAQKHGAKFRQMISQIKGGNSGFAEKSDIDARERIKNQIELASKISVADTDTVNRKNNAEIRQNMQGSIAVNEKGQPISLYALSTHGDDLFKNLQVGIKLSTITAMSEMYNSEDMRYKRVKFFECYAVAKKPFYLESEPYELSVGEIGFQMVESGILSRNTYLKWVNAQNQNIANRKMVDLLKDLGYDSIAYKNSNYDKGSISLVVFDEGQLIRVSEDGMLIENNGIEDTDYVDYVDQSNERFDSVKENNEKMPRYLDEPNYNLRKVRKQVDSRIKLGDAGYLEQFGANVIETVEYIKDMLRLNIGVELSGYDNADRKFKNKAVKQFDQCAFRDENGDILTFALWNTSNKNISQVAKMGIEFGTVNAAFKKFFAHKESMTQRYNGVFEEFILNCYNPLVVPLDNWNAKKLAEYLLSTGEITQKYYEKLISLKTITSPTYNSNASQILREKIKMMGYDCIVFVKSSGDIGVIPFYDSQVVPISQNGILNSDCDLYVENEYMVENPKDGEVIKPKAMTIRDFSKVKDVILSEPSATKKLMHLTEFLSYASDSILEENQDIKVGSSGVFENLGHNVWKFVSVCKNLLSDTARSVEINQLDIADRFVAENVREYLYDTIFKNSDGRLLSFFYWNKYGENRFKHSSLGYNLTTLTGVHNNYLAERAKHSQLNKGEYEEYYIKASKPYIMPFVSEKFTVEEIADVLYKEGVLSLYEFNRAKSLGYSNVDSFFGEATRYLNRTLSRKGYDSIVYMSSKDGGTVGVIVFEPSQLIPVSINGKQIENSQLTLTDSQGSVYLSEFVEKEINKNIENLDERAIIKLARAYLRSPEGKKDKRPYLRHRPSYLKNQIEMVYENAKKLLGKVYDPSGVELHWDPTKPRNGQWDMGHIPGQKYEVVHAKYVLGMMTPKEFKTWYSDPRNYRPELPSTNRGHKYE